jgi:adenylosuccinate lyase
MPHKRNPILTERISGLARIIRSFAVAQLESVTLWHERDISNSSVERIVFPDACTLLDYLFGLTERIVRGLDVYPARMQRNLESTRGIIYSQRVMLTLTEGGMDRQSAYKIVQRAAMRAWAEETPLYDLLAAESAVAERLSPEALRALFEPDFHLRFVDDAFRRVGLLPAQTEAESVPLGSATV